MPHEYTKAFLFIAFSRVLIAFKTWLISIFCILEKDLKIFKNQIDPDEYNGATLLGINGISIKSHGNASAYAFSCAINKCYDFISNDLNKKIIDTFKSSK